MTWQDMSSAPKVASLNNPCGEHWILAVDADGEMRVITWTHQYPYSDGVWMYGEAPSDYIGSVLTFEPVCWMPLPELNKEIDT